MRRRLERGDTIIEVTLAFAIFSIAAVTTITLVNSGLATTQRNLEITLVRQQIDAQAEMLRHLSDTKDVTWASLIDPASLVNNPSALADACQPLGSITNGFYVKPVVSSDPVSTPTTYVRQGLDATSFIKPNVYAKIDYAAGANRSEGIWIQASLAEQKVTSPVVAYDFYIHACWDSLGIDTPMTLGTIVRIYE